MRITSRRKKIAFFIVLGVCLVALALTLNISWIILNWRKDVLLVLGVIFFAAIILGMILNTGFLVREIRRNEQHDSFINSVTHELKTPIASIRLYLETLQRREVDERQRQQFYQLMLEDADRLLGTVEQVLKAGEVGYKRGTLHRAETDFSSLVRECMELARTRHHLDPSALQYQGPLNGSGATVEADPAELRTAVSNILDNAIKYSGDKVDISVRVETPDEKRRGAARPRSRRGHPRPRPEACVQALLPRARAIVLAGEGDRPRTVHRARHRPRPWRPGICRKRRLDARHHHHV